jgi:hypothetical protein
MECVLYSKRRMYRNRVTTIQEFNSLNAELNPTCHLLALLGSHPIFHVGRIRVNTNEISFGVFWKGDI